MANEEEANAANAALFSKLILHSELPRISNLDCEDIKFGFRTVFNTCSYSYRCCGCAFEHEYFTNIVDEHQQYPNVSNISDVAQARTTESDTVKDIPGTADCDDWDKEISVPNKTSNENANDKAKDISTLDNRSEKVNGTATAIQYERIESVSNAHNRIIDKNTFTRILQSIRDGQCEHVGKIPEDNWEYITETTVYGLHAVAAVHLEQNILDYMKNFNVMSMISRIFNVHPFVTFLVKNTHAIHCQGDDIVQHLMNNCKYPIQADSVLYLGKLLDYRDKIFKLETYSVLGICEKLKNKQMLQSFVEAHLNLFDFVDIADIMDTVINHRLVDIEKLLINKLASATNVEKATDEELEYLAETSIVHNRPDMLDYTLQVLSSEDDITFSDQYFDTCCLLGRDDCMSVMKKYCSPKYTTSTDQDRVWNLLVLTLRFPNLKDDIKAALKQIPNIEGLMNRLIFNYDRYRLFYFTGDDEGEFYTPLEVYTLVGCRAFLKLTEDVPLTLLHTMFELGASVNAETSGPSCSKHR